MNDELRIMIGKYSICLFFSFLLFFSCMGDESSVSSDTPLDTPLHLKLVTRADANAINKEQVLEKLRLLIYDKDGRLEGNVLFTGSDLKTLAPDQTSEAGVYYVDATLTLTHGRKTFCLIGNETSVLASKLSNASVVGRLTDLDNLHWVSPAIVDGLLPFTWCESRMIIVGDNELTFSLLRAVARVDVRLWKAADITGTIALDALEILNEASESRLLEGNPLDKTLAQVVSSEQKKSWGDAPLAVSTVPASLTDQNAALAIATFYLFEYSPAGTDEPTSLKLHYTQGTEKKSYTVKLAGGKDSGDNYIYQIKRNTLTDLRLTFETDGKLKADWQVMDWTDDNYDRELGSDDSNWWYADWIDVDDYSHQLDGVK
ncbi:FimB/Mfa2 family fimbrial subunit [Bacteroides sp. 224]|uniref:FimB/Mfa2 family fimbrial subunit n=1 Tax=Bacteroides sp. 224 TaxID=2302936 RepID=UPI0013D766DB|nr:FimB/Mfa2 family fimbrial subunit [Bacteroides sp. 224]NDV66419.1 hypothetical protein [Bacteroides sp. 224]